MKKVLFVLAIGAFTYAFIYALWMFFPLQVSILFDWINWITGAAMVVGIGMIYNKTSFSRLHKTIIIAAVSILVLWLLWLLAITDSIF